MVLREKKVEEWGEFAFVLSFIIKLWELKQFSIINTVSKMTNKKMRVQKQL